MVKRRAPAEDDTFNWRRMIWERKAAGWVSDYKTVPCSGPVRGGIRRAKQ